MLSIIAKNITMPSFIPKLESKYKSQAPQPAIAPQIMPLMIATPSSFLKRSNVLLLVTCPIAKERTKRVSVWLPVLPAILAAIGSRAASATTREMVPSKQVITREATKAVQRFTPNQIQRLLAVSQTPPNKSCSSLKPTAA